MLKKFLGIDKLEQENQKLRQRMEEINGENTKLRTQVEELQTPSKSPKDIATENGEPWVSVLDTKFDDLKNPGQGYFELDYNQHFVDQLTNAGYSGRTSEDIVDMWFNDLCRGVINSPE